MKTLAKTLTGIIAACSLSGCVVEYRDNYDRSYQPRYQQQTSQQQTFARQHVVENPCESPIVILKENDPRFKSFMAFSHGMRPDGGADFSEKRWVFKRGEKFLVRAFFTDIEDSNLLLMCYSPNGREIGRSIYDAKGYYWADFFEASDFLNSAGEGDYRFCWAFNSRKGVADFKLAAIQYIRLRE